MPGRRHSRLDLESRPLPWRLGLLSTVPILIWAAMACSSPDPDLDQPQRRQPQNPQSQQQAEAERTAGTAPTAMPDHAAVENQPAEQEQTAQPQQMDDAQEISDASEPANLDEEGDWILDAISNLAAAYEAIQGVWTGFEPNDHPALAVLKNENGGVDSVLALNFPSPEELGDVTTLSTAGTPFQSLHRIDNIDADVIQRLTAIENFSFNEYLRGVDSLVVVARDGDFVLDPTELRWSVLFIHEMFHRYQHASFKGARGLQSLETYPLTAENLALAALEDRALTKAISTTDDDVRSTAARHFAAIRITRLTADQRVALDNDQERFEGTARYLEHRLASTDARFRSVVGDYSMHLFTDPILTPGLTVKGYYSFGRFYASGAAILRLLDLLRVTGVDVAVEAGQSPAEVLIEHLGVADANVEQLVADARQAYDPYDTLTVASERAAETAKQEPPVFSGEMDDDKVEVDVRVEP